MKSQLIELALKEYGTKEAPGTANNPRVLEYFAESGNEWVKDDTNYAWCSAFANFIVKKAGYKYTKKLLARSWLDFGQPVEVPEIGDLAIFWRDSIESGHGHVGFFIREEGQNIWVLGGNQNDGVNISAYPKARLMGYRDITKEAPAKPEVPVSGYVRKGDKGEQVAEIQRLLKVKDDGIFGPITDSAVRAFQAKKGLIVDGIVGPATLKALKETV